MSDRTPKYKYTYQPNSEHEPMDHPAYWDHLSRDSAGNQLCTQEEIAAVKAAWQAGEILVLPPLTTSG